jgi:hypothetical protein
MRWRSLRSRVVLLTVLALLVVPGTAVSAAATSPTADQAFTHPGVLVTREGLDFVRDKLAQGAEPWTTAFAQMQASTYASLDWTPKPWVIVECGSSSNPNYGCTDERNDALAAYTDALQWYLTKDSRYAEKAIEIMDAWSATITDHTNSNAPLQTGWSGASWSRAAELIRYTYDGWPADRVDRFAGMLRTIYLPEIINGAPDKNGNWELIMMDAAVGISVFLDDHASFDKAIDKWRARVRAYIYLTSDGPLPFPPPGGTKDTTEELIDYWQGQTTFVDGLAQETCRDFGHTGWGFEAASHVAETARIQGLDIYSDVQERITKALEFHAKYELNSDVPDWLCGGVVKPGLGPTLEISYNHYHNRVGINLPKTRELILTKLRPTGANYFLAWETLTHAENP